MFSALLRGYHTEVPSRRPLSRRNQGYHFLMNPFLFALSTAVTHWWSVLSRRAYGCRKNLRCAFWSQNPKQKVTFWRPEMDPGNDETGWTPQQKLQHPAGSGEPQLDRFHRLRNINNTLQYAKHKEWKVKHGGNLPWLLRDKDFHFGVPSLCYPLE